MMNLFEKALVVLSAFLVGLAYHPAAGLATLIALDTLIDIRRAIEGAKQ